jgi:hypothetical protein
VARKPDDTGAIVPFDAGSGPKGSRDRGLEDDSMGSLLRRARLWRFGRVPVVLIEALWSV